MKRTILSLCDASGAWSAPYAEAGYDVRRIDLTQGKDVRFLRHVGRVHGVLAAPPCCLFSRAGAWTWPKKLAQELADALAVVDACIRVAVTSRAEWWALENPPGRLRDWIGPHAYAFQPHWFGDPWTKLTYLWGRFTPPSPLTGGFRAVEPTQGDRTTRMGSGQKAARSLTPAGFARAFFLANP